MGVTLPAYSVSGAEIQLHVQNPGATAHQGHGSTFNKLPHMKENVALGCYVEMNERVSNRCRESPLLENYRTAAVMEGETERNDPEDTCCNNTNAKNPQTDGNTEGEGPLQRCPGHITRAYCILED